MKTGLFHSIVKIESLTAILFILTIGLVIAYQSFTREFSVNAQAQQWTTQTSDDRQSGGPSFTEDLSTENEYRFSYSTVNSDYTSFAHFIITPPSSDELLDLDWFTEIRIRARAEGEEKQQFLLFLRDSPSHLVSEQDVNASKYNEAFFQLTEEAQTITITKEAFLVPRWWIADKAVLTEDASPSFSNFQAIEIAVSTPNKENNGVVVVEEITFRGPMITPVNFYRTLFSLWFLLALPICAGFYANAKRARNIRRVRLNQIAIKESGSTADALAATTTPRSDTIEVQLRDELTGLFNKFGLQDAIDAALEAVRNGDTRANIILIDIDDMETLNQSNGIATGDTIILSVADIIKDSIPQNHTAGRWNDDKFLVICHGQHRDQSRELACDLRKLVEEKTLATCSFGVHQLNPINSFEEAYERVSKCVQEAKLNGKNKVVLFNLQSTMASLANTPAALASLTQPVT